MSRERISSQTAFDKIRRVFLTMPFPFSVWGSEIWEEHNGHMTSVVYLGGSILYQLNLGTVQYGPFVRWLPSEGTLTNLLVWPFQGLSTQIGLLGSRCACKLITFLVFNHNWIVHVVCGVYIVYIHLCIVCLPLLEVAQLHLTCSKTSCKSPSHIYSGL